MNNTLRFDALRTLLADLKRRLKEILAARAEVQGRARGRRRVADEAAAKAAGALAREQEARLQELEARASAAQQEAEAAHAAELARLEEEHAAAAAARKEELFLHLGRLNEQRVKEKQQALAALQQKHAAVAGPLEAVEPGLAELLAEATALRQKIEDYAADLRLPLEAPAPPASAEGTPDSARAALEALKRALRERRRELRMHYARRGPWVVVALLLLVAHGLALVGIWAVRRDILVPATFIAPVSWLVTVGLALGVRALLRGRARGVLEGLRTDALALLDSVQRQQAALRARLDDAERSYVEQMNALNASLEEKFRGPEDVAKRAEAAALDVLNQRREELVAKAHRAGCLASDQVEERFEREREALRERHRGEQERQDTARDLAAAEIDAEERAELDRLAARWKSAAYGFSQLVEEARERSRRGYRPWSDPGWKNPVLPDEFPPAVHLGDVEVDLRALVDAPAGDPDFGFPGDGIARLPLALSFPDQGSLFAEVGPESRGRAMETLFGALLRILTGLPPGKAKFLIFDPVGLGQNLAALMHLADHDESLVGGRIWTETGHLERKLAELTEHVEKVIQKYLRNRHATIDEYNREVGPMAEAYRFLVITDFPTGFSEIAVERLASLVASGPRCGVHTLILHDRTQKLPASVDLARLRHNGQVLQSGPEGLVLADEVVPRAPLKLEELPGAEELTAILHAVGKRSVEAKRVEVPFDNVVPKTGEEWSLSSETGLRVAVGRAAAERLQYLELGRGTAQHALIAGKTGSGKSTLFRVLITNLASWYSPREVEFYLIDFKKGVEFKTFATHELPHARVVAIESDREYGVSVLRRLDQEFVLRAERFRKAGVQDFAGYRKAAGAEHLPRTLLLIDEFQEFFTEEDSTAQEAALLLDRIVRQGRAFGVHVILGSQTLGGSYSLAKATLGQMGVRIALQCNEADSYLILSDDNAAARLLSRPGEAIYNDMSGMIEGNNPFQVVWLSDETEERRLQSVRERARRENWTPPEPMAVFEGNVPADLRRNGLLNRRLAAGGPVDGRGPDVAWVGEANAIKGPTEVRFRRQGGGNLLVIGQQRESALAVVLSSIVSLASGRAVGGVRFVVLDGSPPELRYGRGLSTLAQLVPHEIEFPEFGAASKVIEDLDEEVRGRLAGDRDKAKPVFLVLNDLQRFRKLRQDEFDLSSGGEEESATPGQRLARILSEGPAQGVHAIVWCDSLNNLNRTLSRKSLKEFESRILFQMSASDSSELIDSPLAGKLGLHRGLLVVEEEGSIEKFRPYALPEPEQAAAIRGALAARSR